MFAVLYSFCVTGARHYIILSQHLDRFNHEYLYKVIFSGLTEFTAGVLIGAVIFTVRRTVTANIILILIVGPILLVDLASFHYEAVFGRLPSSDLFFYMSEISHLTPSLEVNLPVYQVLVEFSVIILVLFAGLRLLRNKGTGAISRWATITSACVILLSVSIQSFPSILPERYFWDGRQPLLWLVQSSFIRESYNLDDLHLTDNDFKYFRKIHGVSSQGPLLNPEYPLCTISRTLQKGSNRRNAILLILEGVGRKEVYSKYKDIELMPNLKRIAGENLHFRNTHAPGTKSVTLLPAIFSGLPGNPFNNYLWNTPPVYMTGFPKELDRQGYVTAYFHGGDLSFEHQRPYLKRIGFTEIHEYEPGKNVPVYGWGYSDAYMFEQLESWINNKKNTRSGFFVSLFTLSTHDPYVLPDDWKRRFPDDEGFWPNFVESYMYLDYHLGKFYDWYRENTENTLLFITGDHAPHILTEGEVAEDYEMRFDVPLIIAGLTQEEKESYKKYQNRNAGIYDLPATLMELLELPPPGCGLGVSLVSPDAWPEDRIVYSFGGDSLERMHMWFDGHEIVQDRINKEFRFADPDDRSIQNQANDDNSVFSKARKYVNNLYPVHYYLLNKNRYSPPSGRLKESIAGLTTPIIVSHRGNVDGEQPGKYENSAIAIENATKSGFDWVEIDVQLTRDGELVLFHDPYITKDQKQIPLLELTLNELKEIQGHADVLTLQEAIDMFSEEINMLIEIKPQEHITELSYLSREVVRIMGEQQDRNHFIIDSFQRYLASSIKHGCKCEVGFDAEFRRKLDEDDMEYIAQMNVDWVYVHYSVVDDELIRMAHKHGLKVMAYTINDQNVIAGWKDGGQLPDGIITDHKKIMDMFE